MTPDDAARVLVQTARLSIREPLADVMELLRTGKPPEFVNPFTGKRQAKPINVAAVELAKQLADKGLTKDTAFIGSLERALASMMTAPVFSLFAAFDGEGSFAEPAVMKVTTSDGQSLPTHLHEILQPIDQDVSR